MRYLFFTYMKKPSGKIDEVMVVSNKIKTKDWQTVNVILDFKECKVVKSFVDGNPGSKDWDTVVSYYYKHYPTTLERLFEENGYTLEQEVKESDVGSEA